jgi:hypothetical protein
MFVASIDHYEFFKFPEDLGILTVLELHIGSYGVDGMASAEREPVMGVWGLCPQWVQG